MSHITDSQSQSLNKCSPEYQRIHIKKNKKDIYAEWETWKKELLFVTDPAAELIFSKCFKPLKKEAFTRRTPPTGLQSLLEMIQNL